MSTEAAAGKNPVIHVGKIYNLLAHKMAARICEAVADIQEVSVWLCSQIGRPLSDPWSVAVELVPEPEGCAADLEPAVHEVIASELCNLSTFVDRLTRGELPVC